MNKKLRALIEAVQWVDVDSDGEGHCPWCTAPQGLGTQHPNLHFETCEMAPLMGWPTTSYHEFSERRHRQFIRSGGRFITEGPLTGMPVFPADDFKDRDPFKDIK